MHLKDRVDVDELVIIVFFALKQNHNMIITLVFVICSYIICLTWAYNLLAGKSLGK